MKYKKKVSKREQSKQTSHLQFLHGYDAITVWINDILKLLLPLSNPVVIDVLSLLVLHGAHG